MVRTNEGRGPGHPSRRRWAALVLAATGWSAALAGCTGEQPDPPPGSGAGAGSATDSGSGSGSAEAAPWPSPTSLPARPFDSTLAAELVAMMARDQGEPGTGDAAGETAEDRIARLKEIVATHGWPGTDLVGDDGEDAAWVIAQHADDDPGFQREALGLLSTMVAAGHASPGNLAYLTDRVAVGAGEPQTYGTQMGCTDDGPVPATPIAEEAEVDARRDRAGLAPLADYVEEMRGVCAEPLPED